MTFFGCSPHPPPLRTFFFSFSPRLLLGLQKDWPHVGIGPRTLFSVHFKFPPPSSTHLSLSPSAPDPNRNRAGHWEQAACPCCASKLFVASVCFVLLHVPGFSIRNTRSPALNHRTARLSSAFPLLSRYQLAMREVAGLSAITSQGTVASVTLSAPSKDRLPWRCQCCRCCSCRCFHCLSPSGMASLPLLSPLPAHHRITASRR